MGTCASGNSCEFDVCSIDGSVKKVKQITCLIKRYPVKCLPIIIWWHEGVDSRQLSFGLLKCTTYLMFVFRKFGCLCCDK